MSKRLLRPLAYLRIRHDDKYRYDWYLPLVAALLLLIVLIITPGDLKFLGAEGLVSIFTGLLQILVGFYIASLAAVATFDRPSMDEKMQGDPPTLKDRRRNEIIQRDLTRRQFLSMLFGYLAFVSIVLYFVGALANLLIPQAIASGAITLPFWLGWALQWLGLLVFLFVAANLLVTTMLGLFYMSDRIHRP